MKGFTTSRLTKSTMTMPEYIRHKTKGGNSLVDLMHKIAFGLDPFKEVKVNERMAAVHWLTERGWGMAERKISLDVESVRSNLTDEELLALAAMESSKNEPKE